MMEILSAVFQGILQGLTEFLPISSSGHLAIYQHLTNNTNESSLLFTVLLHVGTLFAVCFVFRKTIAALIIEFFKMFSDIFKGKFSFKTMNTERRTILMMVLSSAMLLLIVIPVFNGYALKDIVDPLTSDKDFFWIVGVMLIVTSVLMFISHRITSSDKPTRSCANSKDALLIGLTQAAAAIFPGLSRSGSTTATALACGLNKEYATQYSFILSVPAVAAAALLEFKDALEVGSVADINILATIVGIVVSAIVGIIAIKTFVWLIKKNRYIIFSYYCAFAGVAVLIISIIEHAAK